MKDVVTGAFSFTGRHIARRLIEDGREVRTLTYHPDRFNPLGHPIEVARYRFDDPDALVRSLDEADTLYCTYWVRFSHGGTTFAQAVDNSRRLFNAAKQAGVRRVVHVSITNPSLDSYLPYFRGKALVEQALRETGVPHSIVRPTVVFGTGDVLVNNIGWVVRRFPVMAIPGDGKCMVRPVHVEDMARICVEQGRASDDGAVTLDAVGPDRLTFEEMVREVRSAVGGRARLVHVPPALTYALARPISALVRDVLITRDEIAGLLDGLIDSDAPTNGAIGFRDWVAANGNGVGRRYASEIDRHFRIAA